MKERLVYLTYYKYRSVIICNYIKQIIHVTSLNKVMDIV